MDDYVYYEENPSNKRKPPNKPLRFALIGVLVLLCAAVGFGVFTVAKVFNKIEFVETGSTLSESDIKSVVLDDEPEDYIEDEESEDTAVFDENEMLTYDEQVKYGSVDDAHLRQENGVTNILVIGTDGRYVNSKTTRSDTLIILTINENTGRIVMSSIMRDTYVYIPIRDSCEKITHAHAYGGPELTVKTVEGATGIKIDKFVEINFYSFMDIVDYLGGVDISVTDAEKTYLNKYIREINKKSGNAPDDGVLTESGDNVHLSGKQAMGYVRIRYTAGGEYKRTERQRVVMRQLIEKAREADYMTLLKLVDAVADNMMTDYSSEEILKLALKASSYRKYDIDQLRIPIDDTYIGGMYHGRWVLRIDFDKNREALYDAVFGE